MQINGSKNFAQTFSTYPFQKLNKNNPKLIVTKNIPSVVENHKMKMNRGAVFENKNKQLVLLVPYTRSEHRSRFTRRQIFIFAFLFILFAFGK